MAERCHKCYIGQITHKFGRKVIDIMLDFTENIVGGELMSIQITTNCANAITSACGLDLNQAKTVVYWAIATHAIDKLERMPILVIQGGHGTGKSTLIELLNQICHSPIPIDGKVSRAELRDSLKPIPAIAQLDGRAVDTWMPLFQAAVACGDADWIAHALGELNKARENLRVGQDYEPSQLVVSKLVSLAIDSNSQLKQRVALKDITKGLKDDGHNLNSWQVGKILRDMGFDKKLSGGTDFIYIDKAHLLGVANQLGTDDDALKQMTP